MTTSFVPSRKINCKRKDQAAQRAIPVKLLAHQVPVREATDKLPCSSSSATPVIRLFSTSTEIEGEAALARTLGCSKFVPCRGWDEGNRLIGRNIGVAMGILHGRRRKMCDRPRLDLSRWTQLDMVDGLL